MRSTLILMTCLVAYMASGFDCFAAEHGVPGAAPNSTVTSIVNTAQQSAHVNPSVTSVVPNQPGVVQQVHDPCASCGKARNRRAPEEKKTMGQAEYFESTTTAPVQFDVGVPTFAAGPQTNGGNLQAAQPNQSLPVQNSALGQPPNSTANTCANCPKDQAPTAMTAFTQAPLSSPDQCAKCPRNSTVGTSPMNQAPASDAGQCHNCPKDNFTFQPPPPEPHTTVVNNNQPASGQTVHGQTAPSFESRTSSPLTAGIENECRGCPTTSGSQMTSRPQMSSESSSVSTPIGSFSGRSPVTNATSQTQVQMPQSSVPPVGMPSTTRQPTTTVPQPHLQPGLPPQAQFPQVTPSNFHSTPVWAQQPAASGGAQPQGMPR